MTAQARHDIGIWFSTDGDPNGDGSFTGVCTVFTPPTGPEQNYVNLDAPLGVDDMCGDIDSNHNPLFVELELTVTCTPDDPNSANPKLSIPYCSSWRQPGANEICNSATDAFPGAPSKCNCEDIVVDIDVCTTPAPVLSATQSCPGNTNIATISAASLPAGSSCTWQIGTNSITNDCSAVTVGTEATNDFTVPSGTYTVSVTTGTAPCIGSSTIDVIINPALTVSASLTEICANEFDYSGSASGGGSSITAGWTFSPADVGAITGAGDGSVAYVVTSPTTVTGVFSAQDENSCSASTSATVQVYPDIAVGDISVQSVCKDDADGDESIPDKTFSVSESVSGGSGTLVCTWTSGTDVTGPQSCGITYDPPATEGMYDVSVVVQDSSRTNLVCSATKMTSVTVGPPVTSTASLTEICDNGFQYAGAGSAAGSWIFSVQGVQIGSSASSSGTFNYPVTATTVVTGVYTVSDSNVPACSKSSSTTVDVYSPVVAGTIQDNDVCVGPDHEKTFTCLGSSGGSGFYECTWTSGSFTENPQPCDALFAPNLDPGSHTVDVTVTDTSRTELTCSASTNTVVTIYTPVVATASLTEICANGFDYTGSGSGGTGSYSTIGWDFLDNNGVLTGTQTASAGVFNAVFTVTDDLGCTASANTAVNVYPPIAFDITLDPGCEQFGYALNSAITGGRASGYTEVWTTGGGSILSSSPAAAAPTASLSVTLTVSQACAGCSDNDVNGNCAVDTTKSVAVYETLSASIMGNNAGCDSNQATNDEFESIMFNVGYSGGSPDAGAIAWSTATSSVVPCGVTGTCTVSLLDLNLVDPECFAETLTVNVSDPNPLCSDVSLNAIISQTTSITLTPNA